jgi:hypothetical protein
LFCHLAKHSITSNTLNTKCDKKKAMKMLTLKAHGDKCVILSLLVMQLWPCFWSWFFENFNGGGEMNKVHGKIILTQNGLSIQKLWQETCFFAKNVQLLSLPCTREKNFSFAIRAVNFCKTFCTCSPNMQKAFCTCSPNSLGQDLTVKNAIFIFLFFHLGFLS